MPSKKRRQRGSRTHGGGSHKNRRNAGNRGGRGKAGRDKHEFHNYEELGKEGFTRPEKVQDEVKTISIQKLDEDAPLLVAEGLAEEDTSTYRIDARQVVEDGFEVDAVKVLGNGQVRNRLEVIADDFSESAIEKITSAGGDVILSGNDLKNTNGSNENMSDNGESSIDRIQEKVDDGYELESEEAEKLLEEGVERDRVKDSYNAIIDGYQNRKELSPDDVVALYKLRTVARDTGISTSEIEEVLDRYFEDMMEPIRLEQIRYGVEGPITPQDVEAEMDQLEEDWAEMKEASKYPPDEDGLEREQKKYLLSIREAVQ